MAHAEAPDEEVDMAAVRRVVEDHALGAVHRVEAVVCLVTGGDQEVRRLAAGLSPAHEIDVGVAARQVRVHFPGGVQADCETAQ